MRKLLAMMVLPGVALVGLTAPAMATAFGPASAGFNIYSQASTSNPTYSFNGATGTITLGQALSIGSNGNASGGSATGTLANVSTGASSGMLTFSTTVGTTMTLASPQVGVFTFTDPSTSTSDTGRGTYSFDVTSIETVQASQSAINGDSIELYILGNLSGGALGYTPSLTSIDLVLGGAGGNDLGDEENLQNPPSADPHPPTTTGGGGGTTSVPEPMSLALLAGGVMVAGALRRRTM